MMRPCRMWRDNEKLRDDRDRALNEIDALENERDGFDALCAQIEDCDITYEQTDVVRAISRRINTLNAELQWLYREVEDIEDMLPAERAWTAGVM